MPTYVNYKNVFRLACITLLLVSVNLVPSRKVLAADVTYNSVYKTAANNCVAESGSATLSPTDTTKFNTGEGVNYAGAAGTIYKTQYLCCYEQIAKDTTNNAALEATCSNVTFTDNGLRKTPWISTSQGDVYVKYGVIPTHTGSRSGYFTTNPKVSNKSQFTYSSLQSADHSYYVTNPATVDSESAANNNLSYSDYQLFNFRSNSMTPPPLSGFTGWYDYLLRIVQLNTGFHDDAASGIGIGNKVCSGGAGCNFSDITNPDDGAFIVRGDFTVGSGSVCNSRLLIFVEGNLTINPSVTLANASTNNPADIDACLFVVKQDVYITEGTVAASVANSYTTPSGSPILKYDQLRMGVIAQGNININYDTSDGLMVKGFLVGRGGSFQRDIAPVDSNEFPSTWVDYDPRYIEYFKNELTLLKFSTRERGFVADL